MAANPVSVGLWFDPVCPYSWIAFRWLAEVESQLEIEVALHVMSLRISNEHSNESVEYKGRITRSVGPSRIATAVAAEHGETELRDFYAAFGSLIFDEPRYPEPDEYRAVARVALERIHLPPDLAEVGDTDRYDHVLASSHEAGVGPVCGRTATSPTARPLAHCTAGTPTIHLDGAAFFGPVLQSIPRGPDAVQLFTGLLALARTPAFHEFKRDRVEYPVLT